MSMAIRNGFGGRAILRLLASALVLAVGGGAVWAAWPQTIAQCVQRAASRLEPVRVSPAIGHEERLSSNRRFHMKDGTVG